MNEIQAKKLYESEFWKSLTYEQKVSFQLFEDTLCMPFGIFHEAVEKVLGRPVYTHEFAFIDKPNGLRAEYLKIAPKRSLEDVMNLLPKEKTIFVEVPK